MKTIKKLQKTIQNEKYKKLVHNMTHTHTHTYTHTHTHTHNRPTPQKVVTNSKMQNNADHLISLWTHYYYHIGIPRLVLFMATSQK